MQSQLHKFVLEIVEDIFLCVNYNTVAQKLRLFTINAIFDEKNTFLTDSIDVSIKTKAKITSFNRKYYMNLIKLQL